MSNELLPCQFCGKAPALMGSWPEDRDRIQIVCENAKCIQPFTDDGPLSEATAAWNTRTPSSREQALAFTLREAQALVEMFGGEDAEMTVRDLPAGIIKGDDDEDLPAGLYAHYTDYPEEGSAYLGPCEVNDEPATPFEPTPRATPVEGAGDAELDELDSRLRKIGLPLQIIEAADAIRSLRATVSQQAAEIERLKGAQ